MNNLNKIILLFVFSIAAMLGFWSCTHDGIDDGIDNEKGETAKYIRLELRVPEYKEPTVGESQTKAMTPEMESKLDPEQISIFAFKIAEDGTETFWYQVPIVPNTVVQEEGKITFTAKVIKTSVSEKATLAIFANCVVPSGILVEGVTTKSEFYKKVIYSMPSNDDGNNIWDTNKPIPMWHELFKFDVTEELQSSPTPVHLIRAMGRIDVGLNFKLDGKKFLEEAAGISNFKIKEVNVYRTYEKGLVARNRQVEPNLSVGVVPEGVSRRGDDNPLKYLVQDDTEGRGANSYVREIYVPQAERPASASSKNMHCIVIGGYYNGSDKVSYYRLDFYDDYNEAFPAANRWLSISGNNRYVFNITDVIGPGFATAEQALASEASKDKLEYDLIVWDESIHEMHVQGKYYFGLDNRDLLFGPKSSIEDPSNVFNLKYQTNYPISSTEPITFEWESLKNDPNATPRFEAQWDSSNRSIKIVALTKNETNTVLEDILYVKTGPFVIKVDIKQEYINFKYTIDCSSVNVVGTYRPGYDLDPTKHQIKLSITAADVSINGSDYVIETEPINGIVFKAKGTFNVSAGNLQVANIVLEGEGKLETPVDARTTPFTVKIVSNSSSGSYCEATITPVIAKMRVLTMGSTSDHGYDIARPNVGSNKVITSPNNFGPNDNSIIKVEGFEFIQAQGGTYFGALNATAQKWLQTGGDVTEGGTTNKYLADILCVGYTGLDGLNAAGAKVIADYMKNGGVVLLFIENNTPITSIMNEILSTSVSINSVSNHIRPFVGHSVYKNDTDEKWAEYQFSLMGDPILNGPFGDLRDKQWGEDVAPSKAVISPTLFGNPDIMVYSYAEDLRSASASSAKNGATGFKYETDINSSNLVSLVYFGDGGFVSAGTNGQPYPESGYTLCPFWWNTSTYFPIAKPNYGGTSERSDVYNSQAFCNIMAWAVQRSADLFAKREAAMGR
ncbi:hypothetical protein [Dysgonomonas massiliensis]|uniref:hypothetical protein n=1 Tax=Dysgonomonas massiliensis TaxID=2040292 RepID=UPI0011AF9BD0|nr:hypothetical protein [Dysgonomonas massiliensis]